MTSRQRIRREPLGQAARLTLERFLVHIPATRLAIHLASSTHTIENAASGATLQPATRQRLETAIAKFEKQRAAKGLAP